MEEDDQFIENTRITMIKKNMSMIGLARGLDMSQSNLSQYMNKYRPIPDSVKDQITNILTK